MFATKKKLKIFILGFLLVEMFFTYAPARAQTTQYTGVQQQLTDYLCTPSDASTNPTAAQGDLYNCINRLYRFALVVASVFSVFMIVIGGYIYMSAEGNQESVDKAKSILISSVTSIVILAGGYVLLKFLNPDLIKFQPIQPPSVVGQSRSYSFGNVPASGSASGVGGQSEEQIRAVLSQNGISVNKAAPQTQLAGMQDTTINEIIGIKKACGCTVTVTGGTEGGHSEKTSCSHGNGKKFDLGMEAGLTSYITKNFSYIGKRSDDGAEQWKNNASGAIYAKEDVQGTGPHWDVAVCSSQTTAPTTPTQTPTPAAPAVVGWADVVRPWFGTDPYPNTDYSNTKSELLPAVQTFNSEWQKQGGGNLQIRQVYRPADYQNHLRSIWEISKIANNQNFTVGYGCENYQHLDSTKVKQFLQNTTASEKAALTKEYSLHEVSGPVPPACTSDHSLGIAVDITPPATSGTIFTKWLQIGESVGLCHYIAGDTPHFALKKYLPPGTNCQTP